MRLTETSLIKKYEKDIGDSISDVGGDVRYDLHWLPFLDENIENQLIGGSAIDKKIDERIDMKFDTMGITEEAISSWNQAVEDLRGPDGLIHRVNKLEEMASVWNASSYWKENI